MIYTMKKLITILLCFIGTAGHYAFGGLPVTNVGDVYNAGKMKSIGAFHEKTDYSQSGGMQSRFLNTAGAELQLDTLILYSNPYKDGLFANLGKVSGVTNSTAPQAVIVRRSFTTMKDKWVHVSFPFNVREIIDPTNPTAKATESTADATTGLGGTGTKASEIRFGYLWDNANVVSNNFAKKSNPSLSATVPGTIYVTYFDPKLRADSSYLHDVAGPQGYKVSGWRDTLLTKGRVNDNFNGIYFQKGKGYMLMAEAGVDFPTWGCPDSLDFVANNATDIAELFAMSSSDDENKSTDLVSHYTPKQNYGAFVEYMTDYGSGWNYIGGRFESTFDMKGSSSPTVDFTTTPYNGVIYVRDNKESRDTKESNVIKYKQIDLDSYPTTRGEGHGFVLSPYSPFFVQVLPSANQYPTVPTPKFTFKKEGLSTFFEDPAHLYRAPAQETPEDFFTLTLNEKGNLYEGSQTIIRISDKYSDDYLPQEDAVTFNVGSPDHSNPTIWTLAEVSEHGIPVRLFKNSRAYATADTIPLGFSVPAEKHYLFTLSALKENRIEDVLMWDKSTNKKPSILSKQFALTSKLVEADDSRFALIIKYKNGTDISTSVGDDDIYAYVKDSWLTVENLAEGDRVRVLDLTGRTVATGPASGGQFRATLNQKGVYLVNVKGQKSVTIRVLNK
jgi:hypothetical protein